MAAARDQAARILRDEPDPARGRSRRARLPPRLPIRIRAHLSDETARRTHEAPDRPAVAKPVAPEAAAAPAAKAPKTGKKTLFFGVVALLALAAARLWRALVPGRTVSRLDR